MPLSEKSFLEVWRSDLEKILSGEGEVLDFLNLNLDSNQKLRMAEHLKAQRAFYSGNILEAKNLLLQAIQTYGEHVECQKDLACCYYQLGEMQLWRKSYTKLITDLHRLENRLGLKAQINCWITIAKFLEEEGHVNEALKVYRKYYGYLLETPDDHRYLRILPQLVRLESQIDSEKDLGQLYTDLLRLKGADLAADLNIEIQHSLMLAELSLVGPDHAWIRVNSVLNTKNVIDLDKNFILYDFLEMCLLQEIPLPPAALKAIEVYQGQCIYEVEIRRLTKEPDSINLEHLSLLASDLSWANYLRILILWIRVSPTPGETREIKNKINLILSSFKPESRNFWMNRIKFVMGQAETRLVFNPQTRHLSFQTKSTDLSKKKGMQTLICKLSEKPQQGIDDMIRALWESDFTPEHYHRLRMTVHRLNGLIFDLTSIPKSIEVSSERVALRHEIKLLLKDDLLLDSGLENGAVGLS